MSLQPLNRYIPPLAFAAESARTRPRPPGMLCVPPWILSLPPRYVPPTRRSPPPLRPTKSFPFHRPHPPPPLSSSAS
eukprot:1180778-Prorocentrum_minimum.AAC.3